MPVPILAQPVAVAPQSALKPAGTAAAEIGWLWDLMLWMGSATTLLVVALLLVALFRRRRPDELPPEADRPPDPRGELANDESAGRGRNDLGRPRSERLGARWMIIGGVIFPTVVLTVLFVLTLTTMGAMYPRRFAPAPVTIEVTGVQWWWEVRYLDDDPSKVVRTANEIHIPVGQRVRLLLRSQDVIHSFWVPGLHGKTDMVPGRTNLMWLQADRPGTWRGQCAEYCGMQHAKMALVVVAEPPADFARWLARERQPALEPQHAEERAGREHFLRSGCAFCHTVRGTEARATAGPDLTHVASRRTLAGGILPNTKGHLYGWIADPQALKPGSKMPAVPLDKDAMHAVVHYLGSLR